MRAFFVIALGALLLVGCTAAQTTAARSPSLERPSVPPPSSRRQILFEECAGRLPVKAANLELVDVHLSTPNTASSVSWCEDGRLVTIDIYDDSECLKLALTGKRRPGVCVTERRP